MLKNVENMAKCLSTTRIRGFHLHESNVPSSYKKKKNVCPRRMHIHLTRNLTDYCRGKKRPRRAVGWEKKESRTRCNSNNVNIRA